jgi:hypothetical protein
MEKDFLLKKIPVIGKSILISAFPATGKTSYCNFDYMPEGFACDSDSSKFDKTNFPENYIEHIKEMISNGYSRIFVSSHKDVRDALLSNDMPFVLIYPKIDLKEEYLNRYKNRGNSEAFIKLISDNWENWINECKNQKGCFHIELESNQFIANVI